MRIFLSSPGGLDAERAIVLEEIASFSAARSGAEGASVVRWPQDIGAGKGDYSQSVINRQTAQFDVFLCLVASRMGTPTPRANSGTEEEFDRAFQAMLQGQIVEFLLFFSNMPERLRAIDANQLALVRAFQEKASRLGILFHHFQDHEDLRRLFRRSLEVAAEGLLKSANHASRNGQRTGVELPAVARELGSYHLRSAAVAPQRADARLLQIVQFRGRRIVLSGEVHTASPYFRVGFKYYECHEPLFGAGSIQTNGQNMVVHLGRNDVGREWFVTAYRSGIRLADDRPILGSGDWSSAQFRFEIEPHGFVRLLVAEEVVHETYFMLDGLPALALLGWSDEREFSADIRNAMLYVSN